MVRPIHLTRNSVLVRCTAGSRIVMVQQASDGETRPLGSLQFVISNHDHHENMYEFSYVPPLWLVVACGVVSASSFGRFRIVHVSNKGSHSQQPTNHDLSADIAFMRKPTGSIQEHVQESWFPGSDYQNRSQWVPNADRIRENVKNQPF